MVCFQMHCTDSPNCPAVHITVSTTSLTASIQKLQMTWLPEWYSVQAASYNGSIASIVHSSAQNGTASHEVTSLEPDTVYNITVIPCNMAGCNESCDVHSVQTKSGGSGGIEVEGEMSQFAHNYTNCTYYDECLYSIQHRIPYVFGCIYSLAIVYQSDQMQYITACLKSKDVLIHLFTCTCT